jgi:hypothetical protein
MREDKNINNHIKNNHKSIMIKEIETTIIDKINIERTEMLDKNAMLM